MVVARQWTGQEAAALRHARRMSVRAYAAHLGVTTATVELAGLEASDGRQVDVARLRSDVYALTGWTLIKAE